MSEPKHTPGPWRWELNLKGRQIRLAGGNPAKGFGRYDMTVMDFDRWGMHGAQPRFRDGENLMVKAQTLGKIAPGREHHSHWFQLVNHPDMRLIEAAPDLLEACQAIETMAEAMKGRGAYSELEQAAINKAIAAVRKATQGD